MEIRQALKLAQYVRRDTTVPGLLTERRAQLVNTVLCLLKRSNRKHAERVKRGITALAVRAITRVLTGHTIILLNNTIFHLVFNAIKENMEIRQALKLA